MTAPTTTRAGIRSWLALAVLTLTVVLLAVDGTVLVLAIPALTADLSPTTEQLLWIGDIYSFALAGLLVTMGNLADRIGRKKLLLIGAFGFGLSSLLAAFAPTAELLIAARAILGISGATIMPSTLSIVRNIFDDPRQRTRAVSIWSAGAMAGMAAGPLVGGLLLEHFWWGSVFLINVPIMIVVVVAGIFLLPESRNPSRSPVDLVSAALSILTIVPLVYVIKQLFGHGFDLISAVALVVGIGSGILFVLRQRRLTNPLIDLQLFRIPALSGAIVANGIAIFAFVGVLFFLSQYLQLVVGLTPLQAGLVELPSTVASLAVVLIASRSVRLLGRGPAIGVGLAVSAASLGLLALAEGLPGVVGIVIALVVMGLGSGLSMTLSTDAVVSAAPKERAGAASSLTETAYELGVALGIAVLGSLQSALYRAQLPDLSGVPDATRDAVEESLAQARSGLDLSTTAGADLFAGAQHAFTSGMQVTSLIAAGLLVVSAVVAWRMIPAARS